MNKIYKNTLILAAITVVSGLVLGAAYEVTKGPIAQTPGKAETGSLSGRLSGSRFL